MHDPKILAFRIGSIFKRKTKFSPEGHRNPLIDIWHCDPESDGSDDSCGWFCPPLTAAEKLSADGLIDNPDDNLRHWFKSTDEEDMRHHVRRIFQLHKRLNRKWYQHPRWHIHHWQINLIPIRRFKRWAFTRCSTCGERFKYGESPISSCWNNDGPRWFRGEPYMQHSKCSRITMKHTQKQK